MYTELEKNISYNFRNKTLLKGALFHSSLKRIKEFERLEFLGDRVLGLAIAKYLYLHISDREGELSRRHANLVCSKACYFIANSIELSKFLNVANSQLKKNESVLADALEALVGAIFLDSDMQTVSTIVLTLWANMLSDESSFAHNFKCQLQEISQRKGWGIPIYKVIQQSGLIHDPEFTIEVSIHHFKATATGKSKKEAEISAAGKLLSEIK